MRTTVTLDPDVEAALKHRMRQHGMTFKDALNNAVRAGLATTRAPARRFHQKTYRLGARPDLDLTKALDLAARLEDADIARELACPTQCRCAAPDRSPWRPAAWAPE